MILFIALLVISGALVAFTQYKDKLAARALHKVASIAGRAGHRISFGDVSVSIRGGSIHISDLDITPLADSTLEDSSVRYTVHADAIELDGTDLWALLRDKVLHVRRIDLRAPSVAHSFITRGLKPEAPAAPQDTAKAAMGALAVLKVDTLRITDATGSTRDRRETNPALAVGDLDLVITGIAVEDNGSRMPGVTVGRIDLALHRAEAHLKPYYTLAFDSLRVRIPEDTLVLHGLRFTPGVPPKAYHKHVGTQVELYTARVDTLMLTGFDLASRLHGGALKARTLHLAGAAVDIHRDKSIPVRTAKKPKPLAADRVTAWTLPVALDTVLVRRSSVTYHERLKRNDDYGSIAFTDIDGRLTGITNEPAVDPPDLHLTGSARVGRSHAHLDVRMPMQARHTTVAAHAVLRDFPAQTMNRMTDDLLHVNATAGVIHRVEMRMKGDEHRANGTLEMQYEDLHLELNPSVRHAGVLSFVANTVVRTTNMPQDRSYRTGRFTVDRPIDAGLFKYIWISLRTGIMEVVLPPALLKQLKKQQAKKNAPPEAPKQEKKGLFGKKKG
jgi:hypothetical protein